VLSKRLMPRGRAAWVLRVAVTVLFVYIANRSLTDVEVGSLPRLVRPLPVALSLALGLAGLYCQVKRWQIILRYQGLPSGLAVATKTILLGALLAFVTPGRLGELFRGLPISRRRQGDTVLAVVIDKLFIVLATFAVAVVCAFSQVFFMRIALARREVIMSAVAVAICGAVALVLAYGKRPAREAGIARHIVRFLNMSPRLFTRSGRNALLLSLAAHLLLVAQTVVLVTMFCGTGTWRSSFAIGQAYAFMTFVPIFLANIGIREYSFRVFLNNIGLDCGGASVASVALGASVGILIMNLILPALVGLVWSMADAAKNGE
jgi:hypothetical protein